ncbi:hypothetical protein BH23PLA1_BH23PLA1_05350 [soil metagenome]
MSADRSQSESNDFNEGTVAIGPTLDRFESQWRSGARPRIEDFIAQTLGPERESLVNALVRRELRLRQELGERPEPGEYQERLPDWVETIAQVFEAAKSPLPVFGPETTLADSETNSLISWGSRTPWSAHDSSAKRLPTVPGYEVIRELGRGGMGIVYLARQVRLNRPCVLKMIRSGEYADYQAVLRFLAEAEAIAKLTHPNIVQIHALGEAAGLPFIELEYIEGGNLAQSLDGTPWTSLEAARLVESMALAIHEAHRQGIVHRDLKPANVLLTADQTVKITDFGLAKLLGTDSGLTATDAILGTPSYMAPEQAEGRLKDIGIATDIHALGVILYELVTGRTPFRGSTVQETLLQVRHNEPVNPSRLVPKLSGDLETIILKCLEKEPSRRYRSAQAMADDLKCFQNGEPIEARRVGSFERTWRWSRRHPAIASLTATVVLLMVLGSVISTAVAFRMHDLAENARSNEIAAIEARGQALAAAQLAEQQRKEAVAEARRAARQQARADEESRRAARTNEILVGLFQEADIFAFEGRSFGFRRRGVAEELKAQDILDRGAEQIEKFQDDPLLQANLLEAIGNAYLGLGLFDRGEQMLAQALEIRIDQPDATASELSASQFSIAFAQFLQNDFNAIEGFRQAIESAQASLGAESKEVAIAILGLAMTQFHFLSQGMFTVEEQPLISQEASEYLDQSLEMLRKVAPNSRSLGAALVIASYIEAPSNPLLGQTLIAEAVPILNALEGNNDFGNVVLLFSSAYALHMTKPVDFLPDWIDPARQAIPQYEKALEAAVAFLGENHYLVGLLKYQFGQALNDNRADLRDLPKSQQLLTEALASFQDWFGPETHSRALVQMELARVTRNLGHYDDAERLIENVVETLKAQPFSSRLVLSRSLYIQAVLVRRRGDLARALELQQESVDLALEFQPVELTTADKLGSLADLLVRLGRYEAAEAASKKALEIRIQSPESQPTEIGTELDHLGRILDIRRSKEAEQVYRKALDYFNSGGTPKNAGGVVDESSRVQEIRQRLLTGVPLWTPSNFYRPLDPVPPSESGDFYLLPQQVQIDRQVSARIETLHGDPNIGYWNAADSVCWLLQVEQPGDYRVEIEYDCPSRSEGRLYSIAVPGSPQPGLLGRVSGTEGRDWGQAFRRERLDGRLRLDAGPQLLRIVPLPIGPGTAVMNLRLVRLVPEFVNP